MTYLKHLKHTLATQCHLDVGRMDVEVDGGAWTSPMQQRRGHPVIL
jgi:hypothetical protein